MVVVLRTWKKLVDTTNVRNKADAAANPDENTDDADTDDDDDDDDELKRQYCSDNIIVIWILYSSYLFGLGLGLDWIGLDCTSLLFYLTCLFSYDNVNDDASFLSFFLFFLRQVPLKESSRS